MEVKFICLSMPLFTSSLFFHYSSLADFHFDQFSCLDFLFAFARILMRQTNQKIAAMVTNVTASITQTIVCTCSLSGMASTACALLPSIASDAKTTPVIGFISFPFWQ